MKTYLIYDGARIKSLCFEDFLKWLESKTTEENESNYETSVIKIEISNTVVAARTEGKVLRLVS